jgi:phospho-N-acetylmuramoyl-pentapeptide-transferase
MLYIFLEKLNQLLGIDLVDKLIMVLDQLGFRVFGAALASFLVVVLMGKPVIAWLRAKKIGDQAKFDVAALDAALASKANTPTMGGVLIAFAIAAAILLFGDPVNRYTQMALLVLFWMAAVGGADDWLKLTAASRPGGSRQGLYAWEKLVFQLGISALVSFFAFRFAAEHTEEGSRALGHVLNLPFQKTFDNRLASEPMSGLIFLPLGLYVLIGTLFMTGMSNAVNITDGMDGLASGITAAVGLGLLALAIIAGSDTLAHDLLVPYVSTSAELAIVAAAMVGACLGFLWWNCSPAAVFMGDTGSLCLGALIAYIALVIRQEIVVFLMCGVFILEIASVVLQVAYYKKTGGKRIFRCAPYHWHLHMGGWPEQRIVVRLWIISILLVLIGLASIKLR